MLLVPPVLVCAMLVCILGDDVAVQIKHTVITAVADHAAAVAVAIAIAIVPADVVVLMLLLLLSLC